MNYFVEGLQGSGKSTLVRKLSEMHPEFLAVREDAFRKVILERFTKWNTDENIFECSLFQNIVEDMILFQNAPDQDIIDFYKEIRKKLSDKDYRIIYLLTEDIPSSINMIRKERTDERGNELWFPLMLGYFDESPYAKKNGLSGEGAMLSHILIVLAAGGIVTWY